jgi:hypothetical protein
MKPGSLTAFVVMILVVVAHTLRLAAGMEILVDGEPLPMWLSVVGVVVPLFIAWMLWRERR